LFLDTNVLLDLLVPYDSNSQTRKLVENSQLLGCKILVTKRTITEYNTLFGKTRETLKNLKATPKQYSEVTNPFIRTYGKLRLNGESISSDSFMDGFSDVSKVLEGLGVKVLEDEHNEIEKLPQYDGLAKEVQTVFFRQRDKPKSIDVADHDAFHLLLIKTLRESEQPSALGPSNWFLTCDLTLPSTEKFIRNEFNFTDSTSPVMIPSIWNEIISPFLIGIVTQKDLVEVFKSFISSDFTPMSDGINAGILAKLEIDWSEYDWLEYHELQEITNKKFIIQYLSQAEELTKAGNTQAIEELRREFHLSFSRLIGEISGRKISSVQDELAKKEKETTTLKTAVSEMKDVQDSLKSSLSTEHDARTKVTTLSVRMRYISGFSGICLLLVGTVLMILLKETASVQIVAAYSVFFIIGSLLLLMAIAPERVSGTVGIGHKN